MQLHLICAIMASVAMVAVARDETVIIKCDYDCYCKDNFWVDDENDTINFNATIPYEQLILFGRYHMLEVDCRSRNLQDTIPVVMKNATRLLLSHNHFESIPAHAFKQYTGVGELDLAYNGIKEIHPDAFQGMTSLHILTLSFNELTTIPDGSFHGLYNLFALYLEHNQLTEMPPVRNIENLSTLGLNYNQLRAVDVSVIAPTANILRFGLFANKLSTMPESFVRFLDSYSSGMFTLSNNPWICDCNMLVVKDIWPRHPEFIFDAIYCDTPRRLKGKNLWTLDNSELVCGAGDDDDVISGDEPDTVYTSSSMLGAAFGSAFLAAIVTSLVWVVIWRWKRTKERTSPDSRSFIHM